MNMRDLPGYFIFRWKPRSFISGFQDVAMVFKVPGRTNLSSIPDLVEHVCRGPFVPDAVVLIHLKEDIDFATAFNDGAAENSLVRFNGRLPLLRFEVPIKKDNLKVTTVRPVKDDDTQILKQGLIDGFDEWMNVGLQKIFDPSKVIIQAPAGYAYQKPSQRKATYFIRAEQGLETSGNIAFVALAIWLRLKNISNRSPLDLVFVDSMGVATVAYALRELFTLAGSGTPPQIESFHSYGGLENVKPIPGSTLCLISASSSMNLHREWVQKKRVLETDVLTIVTFEDAIDSQHALYRLPSSHRPTGEEVSAAYDIKIKGENFVPIAELPRTVLLRKPIHGDEKSVSIFPKLIGKDVFRLFRTQSKSNSRRRGIYCDGRALIATNDFEEFFTHNLNQCLRASTKYVVYQDDEASLLLAKKIINYSLENAKLDLTLLSVSEASKNITNQEAGLIAVAAICGGGAALLSLSRLLRGIQNGPRTFFIGLQVADSTEHIITFDRNIKQSAHKARIEIVRYGQIAIGRSIEDSFNLELTKLYPVSNVAIPSKLATRANTLREWEKGMVNTALLPAGKELKNVLTLRLDFAFWPSKSYLEGPHHAEVVGSIASLLQRARESNELPLQQRLHSGSLQHVTLDPENFARFDDGVIQAALLRAALPSELDYRGDNNSSEYMKDFLTRLALHLGEDRSEASLEFLSAMAIGRLRLEIEHTKLVKNAFTEAVKFSKNALAKAVKFLIGHINTEIPIKKVIPF